MDYFPAPGRNHLFVPGPSNIPDRVLRELCRPNEDHRSPAFKIFSKTLIEDVKVLFNTHKSTCFIFPTTGTGTWESSLTNTLSPGDLILSFRFGQFSVLWIEQMKNLKFNVDIIDSSWGAGADLTALGDRLEADKEHKIKALCVVHNETSTGVTNNIGTIRAILNAHHHPALLLVDGVSSIGALDFKMDEWEVDVALTGSQKSLGLPPGLGIVCASPKALDAAKVSKSARSYFDWGHYLRFYEMGSYWPYTPAIHLLYALRTALDLILEEGIENVINRHKRLGHATRLAVKAWGLKLCAQDQDCYSDTVTAILVPSHIDSNEVVKIAWKKYNLSLGIGLNKVAGKVFRIGHLGFVNELQLLGALAGVEMALCDVGYPVKLGSGLSVATNYLQKSTPIIASRL